MESPFPPIKLAEGFLSADKSVCYSGTFPACANMFVVAAALQGGLRPSRHHGGAAALRQEAVRLGLPPGHGGSHEPDRAHVFPGPRRDGHHRLHAAVLQVLQPDYSILEITSCRVAAGFP